MSDLQPAAVPTGGLGPRAAVALVAGSSAAVLVVELVALRLLAPYLGLTLETNTLVIGTALTAIAIGSWAGGSLADRIDPRAALGPLLAVSGAVVAATPVAVRGAGATGDQALTLLVAMAAIIVPGILLSAVTPMVTKLRLASLAETGTVVGRLSGVGTVGAIAGTVLTGFVLISRVPVSGILLGLGLLLVLGGIATGVAGARMRSVQVAAVVVALSGLGAVAGPGGCDAETTYHCASVLTDPDDPDGRTLVLDNLRHSYVDLDDPSRLELTYVKGLAAIVDTTLPGPDPLSAHHLGGGGLTLPRWLAVTRPGTSSTVSEIDGGVVALDRAELGLETGPDLEVRVEDARLGLARIADDSRDLVVGDAFGGLSVPWHLATREAVAEVDRVLSDDGVYALNLIDHGSLDLARAEVATLQEAFGYVAVAATPATVAVAGDDVAGAGERGGNLVIAASDRPIDRDALADALSERETGWSVISGADLDVWVGDAQVLTDDYAPVDQLLTPYRVAGSGSTD